MRKSIIIQKAPIENGRHKALMRIPSQRIFFWRCASSKSVRRPGETVCYFYLPATVAGRWSEFTRHNTKSPAFGWWRVLISIPDTHTHTHTTHTQRHTQTHTDTHRQTHTHTHTHTPTHTQTHTYVSGKYGI